MFMCYFVEFCNSFVKQVLFGILRQRWVRGKFKSEFRVFQLVSDRVEIQFQVFRFQVFCFFGYQIRVVRREFVERGIVELFCCVCLDFFYDGFFVVVIFRKVKVVFYLFLFFRGFLCVWYRLGIYMYLRNERSFEIFCVVQRYVEIYVRFFNIMVEIDELFLDVVV